MRETHIASLIVQHRPESGARVDACLADWPELELARREGSRSIVLCETGAPRRLMEGIDALNRVDGVMSVSLVYHHVEPDEALDAPVDAGMASTGASA